MLYVKNIESGLKTGWGRIELRKEAPHLKKITPLEVLFDEEQSRNSRRLMKNVDLELTYWRKT
jgi:hypothetical protein